MSAPWGHTQEVSLRQQPLAGPYNILEQASDVKEGLTHCQGRFVRWGDTRSQESVSGLYLR